MHALHPRAGTITIVMVKKDVESQAYRGSVTSLNEFSQANDLPKVCCPCLMFALALCLLLMFNREASSPP